MLTAPTAGLRTVGLLAIAGAIAGLGHHPGLAGLAWLGVALLAFGLRRVLPWPWLLAGASAFGLVKVAVAHPWHLTGLAYYLPGGAVGAWLAVLPYNLLFAAPLALAVTAGALAAWRWRWPVWGWLPVAWAIAEATKDAWLGLSHDDWLYSQRQVEPVLRAVGAWGWTASLLLGLAIAAATADACIRRSRLAAGVAALGLLAVLLAPAHPDSATSAFRGIGAVHMADPHRPPRSAPVGVELLVWPELGDRQRPRLAEGDAREAWLEAPFPTRSVHHLMGLKARGPQGPFNAVLALEPTGRVTSVRAKQRLFPMTERSLLGWKAPGSTPYRPGQAPPVLTVGKRKVGVLVCVEAVDRGLARQARDAGAELLVITSLEAGLTGSPLGQDQVLATAVLRAAETGLPVVRASMHGPSALITARGRVLARSTPDTDGILTTERDHLEPLRASLAGGAGRVAVLFSQTTPTMMPALPVGRLRSYALEGFAPRGEKAETVILSGDSVPPRYLGRPASEVAAAIASFKPSLVVLDTCYGASTPLLEALAKQGVRARIVAPAFRIPVRGLHYEPGFLSESDPARRAAMVKTEPPFPLFRGSTTPAVVQEARAAALALSPRERRKRLKRVSPPLLQIETSTTPGPAGRVLVLLPG